MLFLLVFVFTLLATLAMIKIAHKNGIMDIPNERSSHTVPTPRGGGISIVTAFVFISVWLLSQNSFFILPLLLGGAAVALIGWLDDKYSLSAKKRLMVHLLAGALLWWFWFRESEVWMLVVFGFVILFTAWMINLYNFMDGIDGIASVQGVSVIAGWFLLLSFGDGLEKQGAVTSILIAMAAALCGFLVWNRPKAKIFMGDVASGFLGFFFAAITLWLHKTQLVPLVSSLILMGVFICDTAYTLVVRWHSRLKLSQAHRSHGYQHAVQMGSSHLKVDVFVVAINLFWLLPMAVFAARLPQWSWGLLIVAYVPLIYLDIRLKAGKTL